MFFLRFAWLNLSPPSPYWEEVALGYDAYSILKTAKDHHGNFLPLTAFESFGDFKPSLYFYVLLPFIKIFGLNVFAVRLPTILASIATIFGIATLARILAKDFYLKNKKNEADYIFLLALFLATISPFLLAFSRSAWESLLASSLIIWALNFWLLFLIGNKGKWAYLSAFFLILSTYAYHSARITAPLLGIILFCFSLLNKKLTNLKTLMLVGLLSLVLFAPIANSLVNKTGQQRIAEAGIFNDLSLIEKSNALRFAHGDTLLARIIYHRYLFFAKEVGSNFLDHFTYKYLFISGDNNPRHSIQTFGEFYYLDLLFFVCALIFFLNKKNSITFLLFSYLFVAILPAAFTKATPHALRTLASLPVLIVFLTFGVWQFLAIFKITAIKKIVASLIIIAYLFFVSLFFYQLVFVYPQKYKQEWQFAYEEMVKKVFSKKDQYEKVYITRENGRPAMYYFFYNRIDPKQVQAFDHQAKKDQGEFLNFENLEFVDQFKQIDQDQKALVVSTKSFYGNHTFKIIDQTGGGDWVFYETK